MIPESSWPAIGCRALEGAAGGDASFALPEAEQNA
jgi:hypothetical protein